MDNTVIRVASTSVITGLAAYSVGWVTKAGLLALLPSDLPTAAKVVKYVGMDVIAGAAAMATAPYVRNTVNEAWETVEFFANRVKNQEDTTLEGEIVN